MTYTNIILVLTVTTTALIAGLFYAYSCSVNPGLGRLPDTEYMAAMQSINEAIQNPVFFISFMGTLFLLPLSAWLHYRTGVSPRFLLLLAASFCYIIGAFGITMFGNVPLNNALATFNINTASATEIHAARAAFEVKWNNLHTIRSIASIVALVLSIIACLSRSADTITR